MADVSVDPESTNPLELLGQGIKAYVLQDFDASVAALSRATELLVKEHEGNDLHDSLGEVYLYYGKALLGLSREQNEALGDAVPKDNEESDDDEGIETEEADNTENEQNEVNEKNSKTEQTSEEAPAGVENGKNEEKNGEEKPAGESEKTEKADKNEEAATNGEAGPSSSKTEEPDSTEDNSQDDEPTDLQVAWEVLELAKTIYKRQGDSGNKSLADTLIVLGEVSLESENFDAAIKDIMDGLEIQIPLFSKDSRTVAETYYKLGVAYSTNSQLTEAIDSFGKSLEYLRNRINVLEKQNPPSEAAKEEIDEIKELVPDIEERIADMKISKEEAIKKLTEAIKVPKLDVAPAASSATSSTPATNISHLVKRKRKSDENEAKEEAPAKKPATENP